MRRLLFVAFLIIAAMTGVIIYLLKGPQRPAAIDKKSGIEDAASLEKNIFWSGEKQLEYANTLLSKGLDAQAAQAFAAYMDSNASAPNEELASIGYKLGELYMKLGEYEKALANFYKSELLNPNADYQPRMNELIVEALEKAGLSTQAEYELSSRTSLGKPAEESGDIAALIGERRITGGEIDRAIENMPEWIKESFSQGENRLAFIRDYVAGEVLYKQARKAGLDKDARIKEAVEEFKKQTVLRQFISQEVEDNLKITPLDIESYYKANKERYKTGAGIQISYVELADEAKKEEMTALLKEGKGQRIEKWLEKGDSSIGEPIGQDKIALETLLNLEKDALSPPVKVDGKTYLFLVNDKRPESERSFEEVKETLEAEYRLKKQEELMSLLLDQALRSEGVKILYQPPVQPQEHKEEQGKDETVDK